MGDNSINVVTDETNTRSSHNDNNICTPDENRTGIGSESNHHRSSDDNSNGDQIDDPDYRDEITLKDVASSGFHFTNKIGEAIKKENLSHKGKINLKNDKDNNLKSKSFKKSEVINQDSCGSNNLSNIVKINLENTSKEDKEMGSSDTNSDSEMSMDEQDIVNSGLHIRNKISQSVKKMNRNCNDKISKKNNKGDNLKFKSFQQNEVINQDSCHSNNLSKIVKINLENTCEGEEEIRSGNMHNDSGMYLDEQEEGADSDNIQKNPGMLQEVKKEICLYDIPDTDNECNISENMANNSKKLVGKKGQGPTRKTPYLCSFCGKKFSRKGELTRHIRVHTGEKPFTCDTCNESFSQKINLITHLSVHTGEKPYTCEICLKKFSRRSYLCQHHLIHSGKRNYPCHVCQKQFYNKSDLEKHIRTHTGVKPFVCDTCGKQFSQRINLITHLNVHTGEKRFQCDICHKHFSRRAHLTTHLLIHTGEKPFTCDVCDKKFARKEHLGYHLTSHTGEKPFSCDICHLKFGLKNALKRHLVIHTGIKPFPCDSCDKEFMDKGSLTIHQRSHNGEKKFSCEICNKKFYRNADVMRHVQIHMPNRKLKRNTSTPTSEDPCYPVITQNSLNVSPTSSLPSASDSSSEYLRLSLSNLTPAIFTSSTSTTGSEHTLTTPSFTDVLPPVSTPSSEA